MLVQNQMSIFMRSVEPRPRPIFFIIAKEYERAAVYYARECIKTSVLESH